MWILLAVVCSLCLGMAFSLIRNQTELRSFCRQLDEISEGSHMELTANCRQRQLLALCRKLNHILRGKDRNHLQYEKAETLLKQNITSLAHDIRTPLTGALGYVQLAQECGDSGKKAHYLQSAEKRLVQLEDMLEEMFLYTKLAAGDFHLSEEKIQLLPLLGDCMLSMYAEFEALGVSPEISFEAESCYVRADEEALRRVFLNLIQNALLHGSGGISVRQSGNSLVFENPIPEGTHPDTEQLFDRFYKSSPARGKGSSGLGLFIVRELMRKMGGDAKADLGQDQLQITLHFPEIKFL